MLAAGLFFLTAYRMLFTGREGAAGSVFFLGFELSFMAWLQSALPSWSIPVISAFSFFGEEYFMVAVLGVLYWGLDKQLGRRIGFNMLMSLNWCSAVKGAVQRLRPYFIEGSNIKVLRPVDPKADIYDIAAQEYSFPSGHSANTVAVFGTLAREWKKTVFTVLAFVIPLLVGFSRVAVGVHFPTDVLAGWALGVFIIFFVPWLESACKNRLLFYAILLVSALPGFFFCRTHDFFNGYGMLVGFIAGVEFERKFVDFQNTKNALRIILRVLAGGALYFGLNALLKLPFGRDFLDSGTMAALLVRCARYAAVIFAVVGVYPIIFTYTAKIGKKKA